MALPLALQQQLESEGVEQRDLLSAATAFFKWRQSALKANFRKELQTILEEVAQEEEATGKIQKLLQKTQDRLDETTQALSQASNDQRMAIMHIEHLKTQNDELFRALEAAEGASRAHAEKARAATLLHQEEVKRRQEEGKRSQLELDGFREQYSSLMAQQQTLLESLAQRDRQLAEASQDSLHHKRSAARLQEEVERLEAIARATGERAAAAEAQAASRQETITQLYAQLSGLRERYHTELSDLKAARVGAAEVQRMKERVDSMQSVNDSLVAARDELRASLEGVMAKLAAGEQRLKRQAVAATMRDSILEAITSIAREGEESYVLEATARLSSELDHTLANNADLAERLAAADAVIAQQQGHIRRMAEECGALERQLREATEHRDAQHRLNAELAAEMQRLAAQAALGPLMVLDRDGNLVPQEGPAPAPPSATSPATSQLEAQSTAVRVILADKAFGVGAMCAAIAAKPGSVASVRTQLAECRALSEALRADMDEVSKLLATRPFEAEELSRLLPALQDRLSKTETCLVAAREDLSLKQVYAVSLEARVLAGESALRAGASLLQGWSGLLSEVAASEDGRLEPDVRLGLREELKTREDTLHRAILDLAATAPPLLGGDPGYAAAQVALREGSNAMMELALTLGDRMVDAPATRTRVLATEQLLLDRTAALRRFREVLASAPGEIADMVERLTAVIPDVQTMGPAVEEMLRCVQHYMAAGKDVVVDVVALQGEVLMLRGMVRSKDATITALEAVGGGLRTGSPTKRALKMVPLEALHAAERGRDDVAGEKAALQSRMVDQRVRLVAARHRLVNFMAALREASEKAEVLYKWRTAAAVAKAKRAEANMVDSQKEQARVEQEAREVQERIETERHAVETKHAAQIETLMSSHTQEVAAMQTAHAKEQHKARQLALEAAQVRVKVLRQVLKEQTARWKDCLTYAALYHWRIRVRKQVVARQRWRDFATRLRASEENPDPTYREILYGPRMTLARRLRLRRLDPGDLRTPHAVTGAQVARMVLQAWRGWAWMKRQAQKVDALSESLPLFMHNMGDRRRLERGWLGLRLWAAGAATRRALDALQECETAKAEAEEAKAEAKAAMAEAQAATEAAEAAIADAEAEAQQREAQLAAEVSAGEGQLLPLPPPGLPNGWPRCQNELAATLGLPNSFLGAQAPGHEYLPHVGTVLAAGGRAPAHAAAANAVAAAQAAGLHLTSRPLNQGRWSDGGAAGGPWALAGEGSAPALGGGGMPPVAGPSEAALARRRMAQADIPGRGPLRQVPDNRVVRPGRRDATMAQQTSAAGVARPADDRDAGGSLAERAARLVAAVGAITAGVADTAALLSPRTKLLQSAMESATDLGATFDASSDEQAALREERERPMSPTRSVQTDGTLAIMYGATQASLRGGPSGSPSRSPSRRTAAGGVDVADGRAEQADATQHAMAKMPNTRARPTSGSMGQLGAASTASGGTGEASGSMRDNRSSFTAQHPAIASGRTRQAAQGPGLSAARPRSQSQPRPRPGAPQQGQSMAALDPDPPQNSVQLLLKRLPGRNRLSREDGQPVTRTVSSGPAAQQPTAGTSGGTAPVAPASRQYSHVGSRLHEETVSTIAKKKLAGKPPERGATNLTSLPSAPLMPVAAPLGMLLPPSTTTPGPLTAAQLEIMPHGSITLRPATVAGFASTTSTSASQPHVVHTVWPHVPASTLPTGGPNVAQVMRRRGEQLPAQTPYAPPNTLSGPVLPSQVAGPVSQPPVAEASQSAQQAVSIARTGKVVRFERMTPPPPSQPPDANAAALPVPRDGQRGPGTGATPWAVEAELREDGPVTYINLPSPVRVNIRMSPS